mmetsp:Transcript_22373/g.47025  ORF Transcript_22373/g.47025 Transcript_22373/m.47025 type:complete len:252 (+) Transcript_22373:141-896(+)
MATTENNVKPVENPLENIPNTVQWIKEMELGYNEVCARTTVCFSCGSQPSSESSTPLSKCAKCGVAAYCSRECQKEDWKRGRHKMACPSYARVAQTPISDATKKAIRNELFARIRFYVCPYAVFRTAELGRGFLFLQSDKSLQDLSTYIPKDRTGRIITRSVLLHFLTLGEFDSEVCKDDFELALLRTPLKETIDSYDTEKEVVVLCRFRCGNMALGKAVLVPDYKICEQLAKDYYVGNNAGALQLNLDDM